MNSIIRRAEIILTPLMRSTVLCPTCPAAPGLVYVTQKILFRFLFNMCRYRAHGLRVPPFPLSTILARMVATQAPVPQHPYTPLRATRPRTLLIPLTPPILSTPPTLLMLHKPTPSTPRHPTPSTSSAPRLLASCTPHHPLAPKVYSAAHALMREGGKARRLTRMLKTGTMARTMAMGANGMFVIGAVRGSEGRLV